MKYLTIINLILSFTLLINHYLRGLNWYVIALFLITYIFISIIINRRLDSKF